MEVTSFIPPNALRPFIKYTSFVEVAGAAQPESTFIPVVDGCPGIIVQDTGSGLLFREGKQLPASFIFGQSTIHSELKVKGTFRAMCVYLQPAALGSLLNIDAASITDSCMELSLLPKATALTHQLEDSNNQQEQVNFLNNYFMNQLSTGQHQQDPVVNYLVESILQSNGNCSLKALQQKVHLSERSFERKFKQQVGISPKLFARICQFQSSLKQLNNNSFDKLTDIAYDNAYADQSHFIRTFKAFMGLTPGQFQKRSHVAAPNLSQLLA